MKFRKLEDTKGFTLLEVMMGLMIFTLGLLLLSSMLVVAIRGNEWSDKTTLLVQAIRDKVEDFRHEDPVNMVAGSDMVGELTREWSFNDLSANLKELLVVVTWHDQKAVAHQCSTLTYIQVGS